MLTIVSLAVNAIRVVNPTKHDGARISNMQYPSFDEGRQRLQVDRAWVEMCWSNFSTLDEGHQLRDLNEIMREIAKAYRRLFKQKTAREHKIGEHGARFGN